MSNEENTNDQSTNENTRSTEGNEMEFDGVTSNNNQKENITMSITNSSITCEVQGCQYKGKFHMLVWALNYNAYDLQHLPTGRYESGGWQKIEMNFCGTHKAVLHRGKGVQLKLAVTPVVSYDLKVPEQRELFNVEVLDADPIHIEDHYNGDDIVTSKGSNYVPGTTPGRGKFVHQTNVPGRFKEWHVNQTRANAHIEALKKEGFEAVMSFKASNGHGFWVYWNAFPDQVPAEKKERKNTSRPVTKKVPETKTGVKCGNCSTFTEAVYHESVQAVKNCYMGK